MTVPDSEFSPDVEEEETQDEYVPVDVRLVEDLSATRNPAPEYAGYQTITVTAGGVPVRIFNRAIRRNRGYVMVVGGSGAPTALLFNSNPDALTNSQGGSFPMVAGTHFEHRSQKELWAVSTGTGSTTLFVLDETFEDNPHK